MSTLFMALKLFVVWVLIIAFVGGGITALAAWWGKEFDNDFPERDDDG